MHNVIWVARGYEPTQIDQHTTVLDIVEYLASSGKWNCLKELLELQNTYANVVLCCKVTD